MTRCLWTVLWGVGLGVTFAVLLWYVMSHCPSDEWLRKHPR
jgi:hypothetical protein